jgi:3'(2'), 5'-bisphosphate nucleotidase
MTPLCEMLERIALDAGAAILDVYDAGPQVCYKDDHSPVTEADERAEAIILERLAAAFPHIPVVAEESVSSGRVPDISGGTFFLVDPLDGTKEFINRRNDFTVNIALIEGNVPVAGIVYAPAQRCAYVADGGRAEKLLLDPAWALEHRQPIRARMRGAELTAVASRSHNSSETEAFLTGHGVMNYASVGSSLKFCLLAEGKADVYPRFGRTIALIEGNVPVAGIVYAPAQRCAYVADGGRAEKLLLDPAWALEHRQAIRVRVRGAELTAVASRSHNSSETEAFLTGHGVMNYASVGSSLKFCLLAEGKADVYPRFGRTMEWDTAAGDAVLKAAGGSVVRLDGSRLLYGKTVQEEDSAFANPHFIAWADMSLIHLSGAEGLQPAYALS